jgi:hypothetical protein
MTAGRITGSGKRRVSRNIVKILNIIHDYSISSTEGNQHSYSNRKSGQEYLGACQNIRHKFISDDDEDILILDFE